jgi:hypothetical protein
VIGSVVAVVSIALAAAVLSNRTPKSPATLAGPPASAGQTSTKAGTPSVPISAAWQQVAGWPVGGAGAGNTDTVALAERALSAVLRQGDITDVVQQRLLVVGPECALAALRDHAGRLTVVVFGLSKGSDGVFPWVPGAPTSEAAGVYALVTGVGAGTQCVAVAASPTITRIVVSDSANATSDRQISAQHGDAIWTEAAGNPASPIDISAYADDALVGTAVTGGGH